MKTGPCPSGTTRALAAGTRADEIADVLLAIAPGAGLARVVCTVRMWRSRSDTAPAARTTLGATFVKVTAGYAERLAQVDGRLYLSGLDPDVAERLHHTGRLEGLVRIFEATPLVGESTEAARHAAEAWLVDIRPAELPTWSSPPR
jgi:hypothetical protein